MKRILPFCLLLVVLGSCKKLLQVPTPENEITPGQVFSSDANAQNALAGLYIQIMNNSQSLLNGGMTLYGGLSSDELTNTRANAFINEFRTNSLDSGNPYCANLYTDGYNIIYTANSLIAGVQGATGMSAGVRSEMQGDAEFVRALVYFYLVNLYGGVPLITTTNFAASARLPRAGVTAVYAQIVADLQDAEARMSNPAPATALLARVWLYQGQWMQAELAADSVIGNPLYRLEPSLDSVFLVTSRETIWQLQPVYANQATAEGNLFIPAGPGPPAYTLTPELMASWEPGDLRRAHWVDSAFSMVYPYKYKLASNNPPNTEYNVVLRLAETYLIRAEARVQQGNIAGAAADLNVIRLRAGLPASDATDPDPLRAAIAQERRVELFAEWGHRWLDLKRTGQALVVLSAEKAGFQSMDQLYPIPAQELTKNPALTENPGY